MCTPDFNERSFVRFVGVRRQLVDKDLVTPQEFC